MKGLKIRKDSDALAYQRKLPKHVQAKAKQLGLSAVITKKLSLKKGAADKAIATAIEDHNKTYRKLVRCLEETDLVAAGKQQWEEFAEAYIDAKGYKRGALVGVESADGPFGDVIDGVFGAYQHQDHYNYEEQYGDDRIPSKLVEAVMAILNTPSGERTFHLFSHAFDAYKGYIDFGFNSETTTNIKNFFNTNINYIIKLENEGLLKYETTFGRSSIYKVNINDN